LNKGLIENYLTPRVANIEMSGSRTIRIYDVGPPDVPLVVGIHGTPSTGLEHIVRYVANAPLFCRLVTFDRQGYGGSTPARGRTVADIAPVVRAILDHFAVGSAAVFGHSGGGMLALAAAALLPQRVSAVACVAGNGPNFGSGGFDYANGPSPRMREEILEARKGPDASRDFYRRVVAKLGDPEVERQLYSENDLRVQDHLLPLRKKIIQQLNLGDSAYSVEDAYIDDAQSWARPWGCELGSISAPTRFFYGLEDLMVARQHSQWMAGQISNANLMLFPNFGHDLYPMMPHVLAWLVSEERTAPR